MNGSDLIAALPKEMVTGLDTKEFGEIIARYRDSLYPEAVTIDLAAADRVAQTLDRRRPAPGRHQHRRAARHLDREGLVHCASATSVSPTAASRSSKAPASKSARASS